LEAEVASERCGIRPSKTGPLSHIQCARKNASTPTAGEVESIRVVCFVDSGSSNSMNQQAGGSGGGQESGKNAGFHRDKKIGGNGEKLEMTLRAW
jgi:hypothetical protein